MPVEVDLLMLAASASSLPPAAERERARGCETGNRERESGGGGEGHSWHEEIDGVKKSSGERSIRQRHLDGASYSNV